MNHEGYQSRLDQVKDVLRRFGLSAKDITPIAYEEDCPFPYNNFIYKISLSEPATPDSFSAHATPCTFPPPSQGVTDLVIRLSNSKAEGLNHANRVENEVASLHLARKGLESPKPELAQAVPAVFAWQSAKSPGEELGWILMEFKPGELLDAHFASLSDDEKKSIVDQIADVFSGIQSADLPDTVTSYGGLTVNDKGEIISGQMTTMNTEDAPWSTYADFWKAKLASQLKGAEESPALKGWKPNGVRERIDKFLASDLEGYLVDSSVDLTKRALIHGDLTMNNILFDKQTSKLTAILDFDFSSVLHPAHEFFTSLQDLGGNTGGVFGPDPTAGLLSDALLTGDFDVPGVPEEAADLWSLACAWDAALAARDALRPSTVAGMETLEGLRRLEAALCPFRLAHPMFLKRKTEEETEKERAVAEETLLARLGSLGF